MERLIIKLLEQELGNIQLVCFCTLGERKLMNTEKITIEIDEQGGIKAITDGIVGSKCVKELDYILNDATNTSSTKTKDYYKKVKVGNKVSN